VDYTAVSPSDNWQMPAKYYRRTDQHVQFFTLDTNTQMFGTDAQQETDVSSWLDNSTSRWKIALGLHSYRSNGEHGNAGTYDGLQFTPAAGVGVRDFMEDHICGEADVYFSAYDHTLQWPQQDAETCPGTELIVSATAASSTDLDETPGYPTHFQSEALGFAYVEIEDDEMTVDFIDKTGAVLFSRTVTK
jgi:tartrate-resistant acid phosphatase type 5